MKNITFVLILLNFSFSNSQNLKIIKESFIKENSLNIDKVSIENNLPKGDIIYLKAKFKINEKGDFSKIIIHENSKIFTEELTEMIKRIPKLNPKEYATTEVYYDLHATIKLDSPKKRNKRIKNSKEEIIKFEKIFIALFLPYKNIKLNKKEIFNLSQLDTAPILTQCKNINLDDNIEISNCLNKNLSKHLNRKFNSRILQNTDSKRVVINFIISTKGEIININAKSDDKILREEAIRAASLLPYSLSPGMKNGKPAYVRIRIPINIHGSK